VRFEHFAITSPMRFRHITSCSTAVVYRMYAVLVPWLKRLYILRKLK